jgi:hypothetical protein
MNVDTVLDVMLNMTALLFMTEIDDIGFHLAKMGFVSGKLQQEAEAVMDIQLPKQNRKNIYRRLLYLFVLGGLFTGYGILKKRQLEGFYLPTNIYGKSTTICISLLKVSLTVLNPVQFGDEYNPKIPFYSGILTSGKKRTADYRQYRDIGTRDVLLAYCNKEQAWTFSDNNDPCDFFAKSRTTETYDVSNIASSEWSVLDSIDRLQPFGSFSLVERDCDRDICQGTCGADGLCECTHDEFGMDCEFMNVCQDIGIDFRLGAFPPVQLARFRDFCC